MMAPTAAATMIPIDADDELEVDGAGVVAARKASYQKKKEKARAVAERSYI